MLNNKHFIGLFFILFLVVYSNYIFLKNKDVLNSYKNKKEVKGININNHILPYPQNSKEKAITYNQSYKQVTLKVPLNYIQINDFYKNIFEQKKLKIEYFEENENFIKTEYKSTKGNYILTISKLPEENNTTLIIEFLEK